MFIMNVIKDMLPAEIDEIVDLFENLPKAGTIVKAIKYVKRKRIEHFFKTIDLALDDLPPDKKIRFNKYIEDEMGKEILNDFCDSVLTTSSKDAIAALGLLYADTDSAQYETDFKRLACYALRGITDDMMNGFMVLCNVKPFEEERMIYKIVRLSQDIYEENDELRNIFKTPENALALVDELIRRRMFLPDHTSMRFADSKKWSVCFGTTEKTILIHELIARARKLTKTIKD
jgi:hypothetical protein